MDRGPTAYRARTVACLYQRISQQHAERVGVPPEEYERRTGVDVSRLWKTSARIGVANLIREMTFMRSLPQPREIISGSDLLARMVALLPSVGGAILSAPDIGAALDTYLRFRPLIGQVDTVSHVRLRGDLFLDYVEEEGFGDFDSVRATGMAMLVTAIIRYCEPSALNHMKLHLPQLPPPWIREALEGRLSTRVGYGPRPRLHVPRELQKTPSVHSNPTLHALLSAAAEAELRELERADTFGLVVERTLRELTRERSDPWDTALLHQQLCQRLQIPPWTLRRRLHCDRVSFRTVYERIRLEDARRLLCDDDLSLGEISERLGFASQSAFSRFFRKAEGMEPSRYRQYSRDPVGLRA